MMNKQKSSTLQHRADETDRRTLCGVIKTLDDNCVLDPDDVVIVTLCDTTLWDISRTDFPHIPQRYVLSKVKMDKCDYFPIPFTLYYNAEEIDGNLCYGIRVEILDKHQDVKFSSERFIEVLTDQYPKTNVHITVVPYSNPSTTTTTTYDKNRRS